MNELPLWYKLTSAATIVGLAGCTVNGGVSPTIDSNPGGNSNPNNVESIPTKTDLERAKETLNSFVISHPEYSNREASVVNFSVNNIDSNTVILETTEEEIQEISNFKYEFDGHPLQQYDKAIVFTMKTNPDGKNEWVRLAGVWFPTEDGSVNTAWYYSPDAFDTSKEVIDFKQRVFGFNSRDDEYVFWPLIEPPYQMLWSPDISSKDSNDYTPWNGIDPFTLPVGAIPVGAGKALFAPMHVDIKLEDVQTIGIGSELNKLGIPEGAKLGEVEGNPIYYVTNPAGETVTVGVKNEKGKWELSDSVKYKLVGSKEEALNNVFDYDFVMRGGPGQVAKLNGEPFPEDVITGLNVDVFIPNITEPYYKYVYWDTNGKGIIRNNPGREPYKNMGWFSFVNDVDQTGIGTVWQWINPDKSIVYITTLGSSLANPGLVVTPFFSFNHSKTSVFATNDKIGHDPETNTLIQQFIDTNTIPIELQNKALSTYSTFNP